MFNEEMKSKEQFGSVISDNSTVCLILSDDNGFDLQSNFTKIVEAIEDEENSIDNILQNLIETEDIDLQSNFTQNVETMEYEENNIDMIHHVPAEL